MAEVRIPASAASSAAGPRSGTGFELRLERGGTYVRLAGAPIVPGLSAEVLTLQVPDVRFPFDVGQGAAQFRHRLSDLVRLEVLGAPALADDALRRLDAGALGLTDLRVAFRSGFAELAGRLAGGPAFTLRAGLVADGDQGITLAFHSPRLYGPAPLPAAALPALARRAVEALGDALPASPLAPLLRRVLAPRGWKVPRAGGARLARAEIAADGVRLAWDREAPGPTELAIDPDLLAAAEGARAFREPEALLARGDFAGAREAWLAAGAAAADHPFAAERLLALLCLEERFHDEALDLAAGWRARRPDFAPALAAEAWIRLARGEEERASRALSELAAATAAKGEAFGPLAAADAAFALSGADRAALARAVDVALALRRDHLPALRTLRDLAAASGDREALLRASRRLVAYDPDDARKARAHAELGALLLEADPPAARLHLDQAIRLAPDDPDALAALARACEAAGEPLRAARALDRRKELLLARGDRSGAAADALRAGAVWEERLAHDENALLRYREACELAPGAEPHARAARVAERLGQWAEAADHHAAVLATVDPGDPGGRALAARTHLALAGVAEARLADPAGAAAHLEAALALAPDDAGALARLAALYRSARRPAELLHALDRLAPLAAGPDRAGVLAEAGALALELGRADAAQARFAAALGEDPRSAAALEGIARLAAARGDAAAERDALARLVDQAADGAARAAVHDRLAAACERAGDVASAGRAVAAARRLEPTRARLDEALRLARRLGDPAAVAALLAEAGAAAARAGEPARAAAAWLERARILAPADPVGATAALVEARTLAPGDPGVLAAQAELAERSGDARLVLASLRALLATSPAEAGALELRAARAALDAGELAAAREHAERALEAGVAGATEALSEVLGRTADDAGRAALLERLARVHRAAGDTEALAEVLARALPLATGDAAVAVRVELADLAAASGRSDEAARLLDDALSIDPASLDALRARLALPVAARLPSAGRGDLLARLAAHPGAAPAEAAEALGSRARLLAEDGDEAAALDAVRAAAAAGADDDALLELRAALAARAGDAEEHARALLARALRARDRAEPGAGDRLAEAGLAARAAHVGGAEEALRAAVGLELDRDVAREAWSALVALSAERGDVAAEGDALAGLVPTLPTGARPGALLRQSALALAAGDIELARATAEEARALAPRDGAAVEACRAVAEAQGDRAAVADRLAELAALDPAGAGPRLLERARILAALGRAEPSDDAYGTALPALPPDRALADEHARHRLAHLADRPAAEPLEAFAARAGAAALAAGALRTAAAVALAQGDGGAALRCARRAYARTQATPAFAAPLLARILYLQGARAEALVLHRKLLEAGFPDVAPEDGIVLCRQLAELAEDEGELDLAIAALDRLLAWRPQDTDAVLRRFELEPDRPWAVRELMVVAEQCRSARDRARVLARSAEGALRELADRPLAERLFRHAREDARPLPRLVAEIERARARVLRAVDGAASDAYLGALHDAAAAAQAAGDGPAARGLLEEAVAIEHHREMMAEAARDLQHLDALAAADGDFVAAAAHAKVAAILLREAGDLAGAASALERAAASDPASAEIGLLLEEVLRAQGAVGARALADRLADRAAAAAPGPERAAALAALADALAAAGDVERAAAALADAVAETPGDDLLAARLQALYADAGRAPERARLLLDQAERTTDPARRASLLREGAAALASSAAQPDRARAGAAWCTLAALDPADPEAARGAAEALLALGRREEAIPHLAALVRADPEDESAARELAEAYADRHRERADLFLARAEHARGQPRAQRLREAARALFAAGEDARARAVLRDAFEAWPADDAAFFAAIRDAAADVDRLDAVLSARARAVPTEASGCHRARADALSAFGRTDQAIAAYETCVALDPRDPDALAMLAGAIAEARGADAAADTDLRLAELADAAPGRMPGALEAPTRYRLGLAAWREGRAGEGVEHLERALRLAPDDARAGLAWTALAHGHAARGDGDAALGAARRRAERAAKLGLAEERRVALEAGAELALQLGDAGADAAAILEALLQARAEAGEDPDGLAPLARRAAAALAIAGERARAALALSRGGLGPRPPPEPDAPATGPALDLAALEAAVEAGPDAPGFEAAIDALTAHHLAAGAPRTAAALLARRADAATDPAARARAWIGSAEALRAARADTDELRAALDLACDADPDGPDAWRALARFEGERGDPVEAARAHLSVSIRTEGDEAAEAALEAARLFESAGHHADAARAYRAAIHARPDCVPARRLLAEEALASGDPSAAAEHLLAVAPDELPPHARAEHGRALARALEAAGRTADAEHAWRTVFRREPGDVDAFDRLAALALGRGGVDAWLELAAEHDAALAAWGDAERRRDLRFERGRLFAAAGRVEGARGAFLSVLELDPGHGPTLEALAELDARPADWAAAADALAAEADAAEDRAEAAALLLRCGRIRSDRLGDRDGAIAALDEALVRARLSTAPTAHRLASEAEALLGELGREPASWDGSAPPDAADPIASLLRAQAEGAAGAEAGELFERVATHLARGGDTAGAADALLRAIEADPDRESAHATLTALAPDDAERLAYAAALRENASAPATTDAADGELDASFEATFDAEGEPGAADASSLEAPFPDGALPGEEPLPPEQAFPTIAGPPRPGPLPRVAGETEELARPPAAALEEVARPSPSEEETARAARETEDMARPASLDADPVARAGADLADSPAAPPPQQARLRRALGGALERAGDLDGAIAALLGAQAAEPEDLATVEDLARLHDAAGHGAAALGFHERAIALGPEGPERAPRLVALAERALAMGLRDRALRLHELALEADPRHAPALAGAAALHAELGDRTRLRETARALEEVAGPDALEPLAGPLGRAHLEAGEIELARERLRAAFRQDPADLTVARDLARIAEKLGEHAEHVRLGTLCADAIATYDPPAAAARYRHFAEVCRTRLSDAAGAAEMLEKALALAPDDMELRRELLALWAVRPETAPRALDAGLELARRTPADGAALSAVVALCRALAHGAPAEEAARLQELGRLSASLAAFAGAAQPAPPLRLARELPPALRDRVAAPGATGPLARLLALLAPYLEPLFPADLARRGASAADRLAPPRAPALRDALGDAARALAARPFAAFLTGAEGVELALENTQPPALVASAGVEGLEDGGVRFLAARALELLRRGFALAGKFAPKDLAILLELACRFAGGDPPALGLPAQRADAFLAALGRSVPVAIRAEAAPLGAGAAAELAEADPRLLVAALRRTANRVALLHTGDPGAALRVLARLDRRLDAADGVDPAQALAVADLRDLALFALSDPFVALRVAVLR